MRIHTIYVTLAFAVLTGAALGQTVPHDPAGAATPVLVELFTSEGCSDCPPADVLLSTLDRTQPVEGVRIIAVEEHVDYWNHLGWADPYSTAGYSARQSDYANEFHLDSVYTPEMVVDGRKEFVGSDRDAALRAIRNAASLPKAVVHVATSRNTVAGGLRTVELAIHVDGVASGRPASDADVIVTITQDGLRSHVARGENRGNTLEHNAVARVFRRLGTVRPLVVTTLTFPASWPLDRLHAIAFVQDKSTGPIVGAGETPL